MSTDKNRFSNIELLRLIAMFFIVLHHYGVHGMVDENANSLQSVAVGMLAAFGKSGVFIFVIIGSFFLAEKKFKVNRIICMISDSFFYSFLILFLGMFFFKSEITSIQIMRSIFFIPLNYWFITDYIFLLLLIPFLNILVDKLSKRKISLLLCIGFIFLFFFPTLFTSASEYSNIDIFIFLYLLTVFYKKYGFSLNYNIILVTLSLLTISSLMVFSIYFLSQFPNTTDELAIGNLFFTRTNSILTLCFSWTIFIMFKNLKFRYVPLINFLSKGTLGVYLIHDNPIVRSILWDFVNNKKYTNFEQSIIMGIGISSIVFFTCLGIELFRLISTERFLNKLFLKIIPMKTRTKIDLWFN